jgi:phosphoglucosamine mutase
MGEHMVQRLFGTDGIRGKIVPAAPDEKTALTALHEMRSVCPTLMRLVGEALGHLIDTLPGEGEHVVIGWDQRPGNKELVEGITLGLRLAGCEVTHIGVCATPALHYAVLWHKARMGCMMTASHNPATDSGIKVFDSNGYKTSPALEDEISSVAYALSEEEREIDQIDIQELSQPSKKAIGNWADKHHSEWLTTRFGLLKRLFGVKKEVYPFLQQPLMLDSSKGSASTWLANWLSENAIDAVEVSHDAVELNMNCGAGDFSPTATWTFEQAAQSDHLLLKQLKPAAPGTIVGAALDGDGDRCLIVEATEHGYKIIDGDAMADTIAVAGHRQTAEWIVAASIESDLALLSSMNRLSPTTETIETAVGDRWLSHALRGHLSATKDMPAMIGVEDSGHAVLPSPHPHSNKSWSLVGDGAGTLVSYLLARSVADEKSLMNRGWKQRESVKKVNRALWDGMNQLSDEVEHLAKTHFESCGRVTQWQRKRLEGEANLMLIEARIDDQLLSLGIRNSGTQAKISVSLRLEAGMEHEKVSEVLPFLTQHLAEAMRNHP